MSNRVKMRVGYAHVEKTVYFQNEKTFDEYLSNARKKGTNICVLDHGKSTEIEGFTYKAVIAYQYNDYEMKF